MAAKKTQPVESVELDLTKVSDETTSTDNVEIQLGDGVSIQVSPKTENDVESKLTEDEAKNIEAAMAEADKVFATALAENTERVNFEESIQDMSNEELHEAFGFTMGEAVGILRDAIARTKSVHADKMNDLLDKIERTSQL